MEQPHHVTHQHQNPLHDITMHVSPSLVRASTAHGGTIRLNAQLDIFFEKVKRGNEDL